MPARTGPTSSPTPRTATTYSDTGLEPAPPATTASPQSTPSAPAPLQCRGRHHQPRRSARRPTNLTATANGMNQIDLSWTAPGADSEGVISGYRIEWKGAGVLVRPRRRHRQHRHHLLRYPPQASTSRRYRVSAINAAGLAPPPAPHWVSPPCPPKLRSPGLSADPLRARARRQLPPAVPLQRQAHGHRDRYRLVQRLDSGPGLAEHRHPELRLALPRRRIHRRHRRPRQHFHDLHLKRQGRAHLLGQRQQGSPTITRTSTTVRGTT